MLFPVSTRALSLVSALSLACAIFPLRGLTQTATSFSEHTIHNSAGQLWIAAHGDFNNDGREDLIVADPGSGSTPIEYLYLSNGDGLYQAPIQLSSIGGAQTVVGDFNHDGNLDYAVLDYKNQYVNVYVGHGDGTFTNVVDLGTSYNPIAVVAMDVNHDSSTDLVVVSSPDNVHGRIDIWLSQGGTNTSFTYGSSVTSGVITPQGAVAGDFDGDGKPDLAIFYSASGSPTTVQVWYGDGAGNFGSPTQLSDPNGLLDSGSGVGDFDSNGTSDLLMSRESYGSSGTTTFLPQIAIFKGNYNRTLSFEAVNTPSGYCPYDNIQTADVNGDGLNDLVYVETDCSGAGTSSTLVLDPATGKGVFAGSEQQIQSYPYGGSGYAILKATQGTRPDLAITPFTSARTTSTTPQANELALMENTTSSSFPACGTIGQAEGINICAPTGSTASSPVKFSISAAGPTPMRTVAVWADGQKMSEQLVHAFSNYSFLDQSISLSAGTHNITVFGTGWDNTLQQKNLTLTVGSGTTCGAPSSAGVHVCAPVNGSTVGSPTEVSAAATIAGTLARMEIWVDGVKMYTETTSTSFDTTVNLSNGYHRFDIYAVNTAGTKYETTVYATVGTASSCAAPSSLGVHVCSPANNSTVNSPVQATATALITGTLARMEVWVDGVKEYTETTSTSESTSIPLASGKHQFDFYAVNTAGTKWETTVFASVP